MKLEISEDRLVDYLNGALIDADRLQVEEWYTASKENKQLLEQLYFTLFVSDRLSVMQQINVDESLKEFKKRLIEKENLKKMSDYKPMRFYFKKIAIAAVLMGVLFAGSSLIMKVAGKASSPFTVVTNLGERAMVVLPDGTKVWLNACSQVKYHTSLFSFKRKVDMVGEAYFEVKKDKYAPFIVNSNELSTRVLGTKFNIRANGDENCITTTLLEGSIVVTSEDELKEEIAMKPNQQLRYNIETGESELVNCTSTDDYIGWISGRLNFKEETLESIALSLERYYNIKITFSDNKIKRERFTCEFETTENIYQILSVLKLTNKFDYKIDKRHIEIFSN